MKEINPIGNLYDDILLIVKSLVIKYRSKAIPGDTYEVRRRAALYMDAVDQHDTFMTYRVYEVEDYAAAGITGYLNIKHMMDYPEDVPQEARPILLERKRARVIASYEEQNNYYRMLHGLPDIDDTEFYYVNEEISKQYGIPMDLPIHKIQDTLGSYYITILEGLGLIDELIAAHPDKLYLRYLGAHRIDIVTARRAKNFAILNMTNSAQEPVKHKFVVLYERAREYFTSVVYNSQLSKSIDYYDNFIALAIATMTIQQLTMRSLENNIERDFFDLNSVQALYDSYNFPFMARLDWERQKAIVQNLNILIQNKATNKVLYDIADLLGFSDVNIYKYFLTKQKTYDIYGNPIIATKQEVNPDTGELETVYDYESMYGVYFQKVELKDIDFMKAWQDDYLKEDYEERTVPDPFWWEDSDLYREVWEEEYNFVETKYLGISISYRMTQLMFESVILLRMLIDKREEMPDLTLSLPRISSDIVVTLFEAVITLICLLCKKFDLSGEIISDYVNSVSVMDTMNIIENEANGTYIDCLNFNFDRLTPDRFDDTTHDILEVLPKEQQDMLLNLLSILSLDSYATTRERAVALNQMYENIKDLNVFLEYIISETDDIEVYEVAMQFHRAIFYTNEMRDTFRMGMTEEYPIARTYFEYLEYLNPILYNFVESCPVDYIGVYTDHILSKMEIYITDLKYLYMYSDIDSPAEEALVRMINFFKSFTTDFTGLDIIYVIDFKGMHMLRLIDDIHHIYKIIQYDETDTGTRLQDIIHKLYVKLVKKDYLHIGDDIFQLQSAIKLDDNEPGMELWDDIYKCYKVLQVEADSTHLFPFDGIHSMEEEFRMNDTMNMTDSVRVVDGSTITRGVGYKLDSNGDYIGRFVKIFESGSNGSTTVGHSGVDGGGSYGSYQMIWSYNGIPGMAQWFWNLYYASTYGEVSTPEQLNVLWVKAAKDNPDQFFYNEHHYVAEICYEPLIEHLGPHFNPNLHSRPAQECFWSWAVHRGWNGAYTEFLSLGLKEDEMYDLSIDELMDLCYDVRREAMLEAGGDYNTAIANGRYGYGQNLSCERYVVKNLPWTTDAFV